jgi:hypothetical protein
MESIYTLKFGQSMKVTIGLMVVLISSASLMSVKGEDNPAKGTYSERFFVPAEKRIVLVEKAIAGDKLAVKRLFLHYNLVSKHPEQALFWAKYGRSLGEPITTDFLKSGSGHKQ